MLRGFRRSDFTSENRTQRLRVIIPTAHNSDDPLFRQPIIPTAHCSDHSYIYTYILVYGHFLITNKTLVYKHINIDKYSFTHYALVVSTVRIVLKRAR